MTPKAKAQVRTTLELPPDLAEWLHTEAQRRGTTKTALLIEALENMRKGK